MIWKRYNRAVFARFIPPATYVKHIYQKKLGKVLDLKNPKTFNEKIQWLKLYYRDPILPIMADKYEAKDLVLRKLGENLCVPTVALFESAQDIELEKLPQSIALKATHGSGWNIIARDTTELDEKEVREYFRFWLRRSYYVYSKEWAYKHIEPRVICERLLIDEHDCLPVDYKVFCFNGRANLVQVDFDRFVDHTRSFYDLSWNKLDFSFGYPMSNRSIPQPHPLKKMIDIAEKISSGLPFLRVDFYVHEDRPYVGELTFYPENGLGKFSDDNWNLKLGDMLKLPSLRVPS